MTDDIARVEKVAFIIHTWISELNMRIPRLPPISKQMQAKPGFGIERDRILASKWI